MNNLKKIWVVGKYTCLDVLRSKILINVALLGLGLVLVTFVAFQFTYGDPTRVALDFGLGTLSLSSVGIALFFGSNLLAKEIEQRTIHMIISRPVPRYAFMLGKLLGLNIVLLINILLLGSLTLSVYFLSGGSFQSLIFWSIFFTFVEASIVMLLVVLLSLWTSQTLAILLSIALFVVGHAIGDVKSISFVQNNPALGRIIDLYHFILPGFYKLNLKDFVLYKQNLDLAYLMTTFTHGLFYGLALCFGCVLVINRKSLD